MLERVAELQAAQARRVRRTDVDGDVACVVIDLVQAEQVVLLGALDRRIEILADVDTEDALEPGGLYPSQQRIYTMVIETHAIDDRLGLGQAEYPWLGEIGRAAYRERGCQYV